MIQALIVSFLAILLAYFAKKHAGNDLLKLSFAILGVFWAIRYNWGNDYLAYYAMYESINSIDVSWFDFEGLKALQENRGEVGWVLINKLCKPIGFFGMIIALSCIETFILYRFVKRYVPKNWWWVSVLIYTLNVNFFYVGASMMRQWLTMSIFLLCVEFIGKKNWKAYFPIMFIAAQIHHSAYLMLPVYFLSGISYVRLKWIHIAVGLCGLFLWWFVADSVFSSNIGLLLSFSDFDAYEHYIGEGVGSFSLVGFIIDYLYPIIPIFFLNKEIKNNQFLIILSLFAVLFIPLQSNAYLISRIGSYFSYVSVAVWPIIFNKCQKNNKKILGSLLFVLLVLIMIKGMFSFYKVDVWKESFSEYHTIFEYNWN